MKKPPYLSFILPPKESFWDKLQSIRYSGDYQLAKKMHPKLAHLKHFQTLEETHEFVLLVFATIADLLASGKPVRFSNAGRSSLPCLGTFAIIDRKSQFHINPKDGKPTQTSKPRQVVFRFKQDFIQKIATLEPPARIPRYSRRESHRRNRFGPPENPFLP